MATVCRHFWFMDIFIIITGYITGAFLSLFILKILYHCGPPDTRWPWHYAWLSWIFVFIWMGIVIKKLS
jgi:ABC-type antimicrobial peptide transport system permease subunit